MPSPGSGAADTPVGSAQDRKAEDGRAHHSSVLPGPSVLGREMGTPTSLSASLPPTASRHTFATSKDELWVPSPPGRGFAAPVLQMGIRARGGGLSHSGAEIWTQGSAVPKLSSSHSQHKQPPRPRCAGPVTVGPGLPGQTRLALSTRGPGHHPRNARPSCFLPNRGGMSRVHWGLLLPPLWTA